MKINNILITTALLSCVSLTANSASLAWAFSDNAYGDGAVTGSPTVDSIEGISATVTVNTPTVGSSTATLSYTLNADLTACGGPASASATWDVVVTSTGTGNLTLGSGNWLTVDSGNGGLDGIQLDSGESMTVSIQSFNGGGIFSSGGFVNSQIWGSAYTLDAAFPIGGTPSTISGTNEQIVTAGASSFSFAPNALNAGQIFGVGNMQFSVTAVVPEPSSTALLGLGALGLFARRSRA